MKTRIIRVEAKKTYYVPQWLCSDHWQEYVRLEDTAKVIQFDTLPEAEQFLSTNPDWFGVAPHYKILVKDEDGKWR